jgi:hypothetical protein
MEICRNVVTRIKDKYMPPATLINSPSAIDAGEATAPSKGTLLLILRILVFILMARKIKAIMIKIIIKPNINKPLL